VTLRSIVVAGAISACLGVPVRAQSVRMSERVEDLEARARLDSCDAAAQYNVAVGYISRNRFDQADTALQRAVALDQQFALAYFALGLVHNRNDRYWNQLKRRGGDPAVASERERRDALTRKAFLIDPFLDVRLMGSMVRTAPYPDIVVMSINAFVEGNYSAAFNTLDFAVQQYAREKNIDSIADVVLWIHAIASAHTNNVSRAIADVESLLRTSLAHEHSDSTRFTPLRTNEYRYMLAALRQRNGDNMAAQDLYRQVIENDIGNYMAHVQLARMHEAARDWTNAVRERRLATEINPDDHTLVYDLGAALARAGEWNEAETALLRAQEMQPRYPRTWHALGVVEQQLGKREEARAALNHFLAIAPARFTAQVTDAQQRLAQLQPQ